MEFKLYKTHGLAGDIVIGNLILPQLPDPKMVAILIRKANTEVETATATDWIRIPASPSVRQLVK